MSAVTITVLRFSSYFKDETRRTGTVIWQSESVFNNNIVKSVYTKATYSVVIQMLVQHG